MESLRIIQPIFYKYHQDKHYVCITRYALAMAHTHLCVAIRQKEGVPLADLTIFIVYPNAIYKRQQFVIKIELIAEMFSLIRIGTPSYIASVALRIVIFIGFRIYKGDTNITRLPFILRNTFLSFLKCRFQPSSSLARHFIIGDGSCFHPFVHFKAYDYQLFLFLFTYILYYNF